MALPKDDDVSRKLVSEAWERARRNGVQMFSMQPQLLSYFGPSCSQKRDPIDDVFFLDREARRVAILKRDLGMDWRSNNLGPIDVMMTTRIVITTAVREK